MRLKILLAPILMIVIIVAVIWFVVPAYQGMSQKRSELKESTAKLEDLQNKSKTADKLVGDLQAKSSEQATVLTYLPASTLEEQIIDNLNYIASAEGVSIYNLSVKTISPQEIAAAGIVAANKSTKDQSLTLTEVSYGMVGSYDKIKNVLQKVFMLKRYNGVKSISIKSVSSPGAENKETPSDNLQADVKLAFDYLEGKESLDNLDSPLFTTGTFDMKAVDDINQLTSVEVIKITPPATGRANPFLP